MMNLPLRAVPVTDIWVGLWDNNERRVCAIYGDYALTDAAAIVAAVNERDALRAENARLRAALDDSARAGGIEWSLRYLMRAAQAMVTNVWPALTGAGFTLSVSAVIDLHGAVGRGRDALDAAERAANAALDAGEDGKR